MYDLSVQFTLSGHSVLTFPTLKHLKDFIKQGINDSSFKSLDSVISCREGSSCSNLVDVTKWIFESYYSSHATKSEKSYIEKRFNFNINKGTK